MHISFFIGSMIIGGAERVIQILANHFAQFGWNVDIVLLLDGKVNYQQFPLDNNISIFDLSGNSSSYNKNALYWLSAIRKYVKHQKPDCLISFIGRINALVLTATLGLNIPILVSERSDPMRDGRGKSMLKYCDLIYHKASAIVFQTKYQESCFSKKIEKKSYIIPNPVSVLVDNSIVENALEISTAGRLHAAKNHGLLIEAIKLLIEKYPQIQCYIYGEGDQRNYLEQRIEQLKLIDNVHLPGNKTDINRWISRSSIFVMTSDFEGLSNALIEAMMLGKACISTDYPGADEIIENGINGVIVPRGDAEQLADEISKILDNDDYRKCLSAKAKESSMVYRTEQVIQDWEKLIDKVTNQRLQN